MCLSKNVEPNENTKVVCAKSELPRGYCYIITNKPGSECVTALKLLGIQALPKQHQTSKVRQRYWSTLQQPNYDGAKPMLKLLIRIITSSRLLPLQPPSILRYWHPTVWTTWYPLSLSLMTQHPDEGIALVSQLFHSEPNTLKQKWYPTVETYPEPQKLNLLEQRTYDSIANVSLRQHSESDKFNTYWSSIVRYSQVTSTHWLQHLSQFKNFQNATTSCTLNNLPQRRETSPTGFNVETLCFNHVSFITHSFLTFAHQTCFDEFRLPVGLPLINHLIKQE